MSDNVYSLGSEGEGGVLCLHAIRKIIIYLNSHSSCPTLTLPSVAAAPPGLGAQRRACSASVSVFSLAGRGKGVKGTAPSPPRSAMRLRLSLANV